jgi:hypothetical protein
MSTTDSTRRRGSARLHTRGKGAGSRGTNLRTSTTRGQKEHRVRSNRGRVQRLTLPSCRFTTEQTPCRTTRCVAPLLRSSTMCSYAAGIECWLYLSVGARS